MPLYTLCLLSTFSLRGQNTDWFKIEKGLYWKEFDSPIKSKISDSKIFILKVNPALFELRLLSNSERGKGTRRYNIINWVDKYNLIAAVNAGMYKKGLRP